MSTSQAIAQASNPYDALIQQIILIESQPKFETQFKLEEEKRLQAVMSDLDSSLSALNKISEKFNDIFSNPFSGRAATLDDETFFTLSAGDNTPLGAHSVDIGRLAATDNRISKTMATASNTIAAATHNFDIDVFSPTAGDPTRRFTISVAATTTGTDDTTSLQEVSDAIAAAMDAAVTNGDIKESEKASSSVVFETSGTARLSLRSSDTGFDNRLTFTDTDGLLANLEINNAAVAAGAGGGMVTDVGTDETTSLLNSQITLDGVTIYRNGNTISDGLTDLTINLKQTTTSSASFTVGTDVESIKEELNEFITQYNSIQTYLQGKTTIDGDLEIRGDLAGDITFTGLRFDMRNDVAFEVTSQLAGEVSYLTDLGITISSDGTLSLDDEDALVAALEDNPGAVQNLFSGADGITTRLETRIEQFTDTGGIIDAREDSHEAAVKRFESRIEDYDDSLGRREAQLRDQFNRLQQAISLFQGQAAAINGLLGFG